MMEDGISRSKTVGDLFEEEPSGWGLRGDPYLWRERKMHLASVPIPGEPRELHSILSQAFQTLTGYPLSTQEFIHVRRFEHGGMSSGMVDPEFRRSRAIPLLLERARRIRAQSY